MSAGPAALRQKLEGQLEGRYRIEGELGRGSMALVYLALDLRHARKVAVKLLLPELAAGPNAERFLREIRITARLRHPNVLPLIDSGTGDGLSWYIMPFVDGVSLRQLFQGGLRPIPEIVDLGLEIAAALGHAHASQVVHRDLKPENVMVAEGHALVMDFGLARAAASDARLTGTGMPLGTPAYMSPEQITSAEEADARSDIYSLGCLLYEGLAGRPPFLAESVVHVLRAHLTEQPVPPSRHRSKIGPELDRIVLKALSKDPGARQRSAEEIAGELAAARGPVTFGGRLAAAAPGFWSRLFGRRR